MKMNAEGDIFKQVKDISKDTWDATTSRAAFENYAIAAGTAFLTAGLMDVSGLNEVGNAANSTANGANAATTTTTSTASTTTAATTSGAVAASNSGVYMQVGKALAESAISTVSSTAAQSAVNGESFSDTIKNQGTNILVGAISNVGAKHIGMNYKTSAQTGVDKAIQLTSHAALGAGVSALTGNDALSGAVSGVVGEVSAEYIKNRLYPDQDISSLTNQQKANIKELAGLAGGLSAIAVGSTTGLEDKEIADNIFSGSRIGKNAAENNALLSIIAGSMTVLTVKGEGNPIKGAKEVYQDGKELIQRLPTLRDSEIRGHAVDIAQETIVDLKDNYDYNIGIQGNLLSVGGSYGTDSGSVLFHANPTIGVDFYVNAIPKGEIPISSVTYGNIGNLRIPSASTIVTNSGKPGFGLGFGMNYTLFPAPINTSAIISNDVLQND